jgi:DGQHR domain-containing protein
MGGRTYFESAIAWGGLGKVVDFDAIAGPENRPVDRGHVRDIEYYVENESQPVFPAILAFVTTEDFAFHPVGANDKVGEIEIPDEIVVKVGDGQHRVLALSSACKRKESLRRNLIGITFLVEPDENKRKQDWTDINDNVKTPNKAVAMVFNQRSPLMRVYARVSREVPIFAGGERGFVEERKNSPGRNSTKLFSANNLGQAISAFILGSTRKGKGAAEKELAAKLKTEEALERYSEELITYFKAVQDGIPALKALVVAGDRRTVDEVTAVREAYVFASGRGLNLLGLLGGQAPHDGIDLKWFGTQLGTLDWSRSAAFWHGHMVTPRTLERDDGTAEVTYGVARGGDVIEEAARRVREAVGTPYATAAR